MRQARAFLHCRVSLIVQHRLEGMWASVVAACGLGSYGFWALEHRLNSCGSCAHCSVAYGIFLDEAGIHVSCIGRRIFNHWTTTEVQYMLFKKVLSFVVVALFYVWVITLPVTT